jgi:pyruvate dehydrogenase E2 component (dihydrolipoamide acetyltransferase)
MESGSIAAWNLKEGDSFVAGDVFCSVETDKATVDFEAQDDGVLARILAEAGPAEIKVGAPIMVTVDSKDDVAAFADFVVAAAAPAAPTPAAAAAPAATSAAPPPSAPSAPPSPSSTPSPATAGSGRVVASPLAYTLAKELGHDISKIVGTGPGGRVIAADVKEYVHMADAAPTALASDAGAPPAASSSPAPAQAAIATAQPVAGAGYTDYPLSDQAREAAARLAQAKRNVPHYYLTVDVSVDEVLKLRSKLNANLDEAERLGVYEFLLKAVSASMKVVPSANGSWMDSVVRVYESIDLNVVVGSGDSLSTPVLRDCAKKGLKQLSTELKSAVSSLESTGSGPVSDVGTFTVLNLGMYGVKSCAPIIREPQSCALAIGALENRIVPNDDPEGDEMYKESVMFTATLSCDHRVVDGAVGAQWLAAFKSHVENPSTLLL